MEIIEPLGLDLTATLSSEESPYPDYVLGNTYYLGERVYNNPSDGGDGLNYECIWGRYSTALRPDQYTYPWKSLGTQIVDATSYHTDADISEYADYATGAIAEGERRYDYVTRKDYEALVAISSGDNTFRPSVAITSSDVDVAARWLELGPANAFRCLDGEIATRTAATSSLTMTVKVEGKTDRIAFFGLRNAKGIDVTVTKGEIIVNESFVSSSVSSWEADTADVSTTWAAGQITVANTAYATTAGSIIYTATGLTPGTSYTFSATVTCGGADQWLVSALPPVASTPIGSSSTITGSDTTSVTWTATQETQRLRIQMPIGTQDITVTAVSCQQTTYSSENPTVDLELGTTNRYRRAAILSHTAVSYPQYVIELTTEYDGQTLEVGLVAAGMALELGSTEADVQAGSQQYHRIDEDEYGNRKFTKRGRSRETNCTIWIDGTNGDVIDAAMAAVEGKPVVWNLNNSTTNFERLLLHGWAESWETVVTGLSGNDYLTIRPLRGLVE